MKVLILFAILMSSVTFGQNPAAIQQKNGTSTKKPVVKVSPSPVPAK